MVDLFDNLFGKIGTRVNGRSSAHYLGSSQVNSGRYNQFHNTATNNNYWMPKKTQSTEGEAISMVPDDRLKTTRKDSITSVESEDNDSSMLDSRRRLSTSNSL